MDTRYDPYYKKQVEYAKKLIEMTLIASSWLNTARC
jgi:hypothetical protein